MVQKAICEFDEFKIRFYGLLSGAWIANRTAGGCRNYINTFANNPQYRVQLTDSDPDDDDELCTVIFAVMQKYR